MCAVSDLFSAIVTAYWDETEQKILNDLLELPLRFQLLVEGLWIVPICFLHHTLQHSGIKHSINKNDNNDNGNNNNNKDIQIESSIHTAQRRILIADTQQIMNLLNDQYS